MLFKALLRVNLYTVNDFMPRFIAANLAVGILFIPAWILLARSVVHRIEGTGSFQRLMDAVAGEDLVKAREFLSELERYGTVAGQLKSRLGIRAMLPTTTMRPREGWKEAHRAHESDARIQEGRRLATTAMPSQC